MAKVNIMFMKHREKAITIEHKEVLIEDTKKKLNRCMDSDIAKLDKLNRILGNGIGLKIYTVTGGRHGT